MFVLSALIEIQQLTTSKQFAVSSTMKANNSMQRNLTKKALDKKKIAKNFQGFEICFVRLYS